MTSSDDFPLYIDLAIKMWVSPSFLGSRSGRTAGRRELGLVSINAAGRAIRNK